MIFQELSDNMTDTITSLIQSIWKHVETKQRFYVIVENRDHLYIESPDDIEQLVLTEEVKEAGIMIFSSLSSAEHYKEYLIEEREVSPSTINIVPVDLSQVYDIMPKIQVFSNKKYKVNARLQAIHYHGDFAFSEILYSNAIPKS